ncbi:glycosyltransferase family 1 protein [Rathayibacter iranicus]|uniref:Glycosyltransferase family 1 protein n=1 Tax=Rathayibacter iranicus TaxID=59737 RepID=A0AAD1ACK5_9MICO|nr:glycosyltransferase family 1 protein [Rathayibacter iranicus]MWV31101.1 glycosyltransferase [Rathayibacter iranicus NCPPB 2253 = VKM Ac-1602]PPI47894.1 glycosyltransferase family 1 protein [Rathayibacter iranicus]PPI61045.1 glycosyltransferase family 1 protein [Rathayibacter iranicus]PPI72978.1 glycosyltransferase family 1 protein [Rathayibacter iranicus]
MVVVNARHLTQATTGVQRFAHQICERLSELRQDVVFVAPQGDLQESSFPVLQIGRLRGHLWEQVELPLFLNARGHPLLVNLMSTAPALYRNQIMTHHDITYVRHPDSFSWSFRTLYGVLTPASLRSSRAIVTVSEFSRQEISGHYGIASEKITVVPNAVSGIFTPGSTRSTERFLLAVSSPNKHKNFDAMVHAFEQANIPADFSLKIVGTQSASFSRAAQSHNLARVHYLGRLSDDELVEVYRSATAFLFPSLYEGFGIPPLEAQAVGTPVLAAYAAAIPEALGDSALYFDPSRAGDMVSRIEDIATDSSLRTELTNKGYSNVRRYSWSSSARQLNNLIEELLSAK